MVLMVKTSSRALGAVVTDEYPVKADESRCEKGDTHSPKYSMTKIPLSRSYLHTAWPVAAFNVMSKPGGAGCNLSCEYCFYRHNQGKAESHRQPGIDSEQKAETAISDNLLEMFIADYIQSQDNPTVFFTWQGGEPTLAGLDFYRKVVAFQQKHARPGVAIANALQTNGVLLDDQWCRFLKEHQWAVGISIDGPADVHDAYRRNRAGEGSFTRVRHAVDCLRNHQIPFDTLTTITPANVHRVSDLYDFLTGELGSKVLQFQPCVERNDYQIVAPGHWPTDTLLKVGDPRLNPTQSDSLLTQWSISAQQWGQFLCELFDLWWKRDYPRGRDGVIVSWFHSWASQFAGGSALMCICSPICGRSVSMERDGSLYSCDHFVYPEYRLGTFGGSRDKEQGARSLSGLVRSTRQKQFGEAKSRNLPGYCRRCPFLFTCYGECPKRRFLLTPEGEPGLNYLCPAYRVFFDHAGSRLVAYGRRTSKGGH